MRPPPLVNVLEVKTIQVTQISLENTKFLVFFGITLTENLEFTKSTFPVLHMNMCMKLLVSYKNMCTYEKSPLAITMSITIVCSYSVVVCTSGS